MLPMFEKVNNKSIEPVLAIIPLVAREAKGAEETGEINPAVVAAMQDAGVFKMGIAETFGGTENNFATWIRALEELSVADGSVGWCAMTVGAMTAWFSAHMPENDAREIFAGRHPGRVAGMAQPRGVATRVDGGYQIEGKFQFASGASFANWFTGAAIIQENGKPVLRPDGAPSIVAFIVPDKEAKRQGNWNVTGMRATSSIDYSIPKCFVPKSRTVLMADAQPVRGSAYFRSGLLGIGSFGHCAVALGMARRALQEVVSAAPFRGIRPRISEEVAAATTPCVADQELFRHDLAIQDASLWSVRAYLYDLAAHTEEMVMAEGTLTQDQFHRIRQMTTYLHDVTTKVIDFAYFWGGTDSFRDGSDLGRVFRNMHAITQHMLVDRYTLIDAAPMVMRSFAESERKQAAE